MAGTITLTRLIANSPSIRRDYEDGRTQPAIWHGATYNGTGDGPAPEITVGAQGVCGTCYMELPLTGAGCGNC